MRNTSLIWGRLNFPAKHNDPSRVGLKVQTLAFKMSLLHLSYFLRPFPIRSSGKWLTCKKRIIQKMKMKKNLVPRWGYLAACWTLPAQLPGCLTQNCPRLS